MVHDEDSRCSVLSRVFEIVAAYKCVLMREDDVAVCKGRARLCKIEPRGNEVDESSSINKQARKRGGHLACHVQ